MDQSSIDTIEMILDDTVEYIVTEIVAFRFERIRFKLKGKMRLRPINWEILIGFRSLFYKTFSLL